MKIKKTLLNLSLKDKKMNNFFKKLEITSKYINEGKYFQDLIYQNKQIEKELEQHLSQQDK